MSKHNNYTGRWGNFGSARKKGSPNHADRNHPQRKVTGDKEDTRIELENNKLYSTELRRNGKSWVGKNGSYTPKRQVSDKTQNNYHIKNRENILRNNLNKVIPYETTIHKNGAERETNLLSQAKWNGYNTQAEKRIANSHNRRKYNKRNRKVNK